MLCINPNFEMEDQNEDFMNSFEDISTFDILIKLRAEGEPNFKVDFHVNFNQLEFLARDMSQVKEYDFEIVVFKFDENCFFTTRSLYYKLLETNLITARPDLRINPYYRKNDKPMMLPQLAYMNMFCKFMVSAQTVNALKELNG